MEREVGQMMAGWGRESPLVKDETTSKEILAAPIRAPAGYAVFMLLLAIPSGKIVSLPA